MYKQLYYKQFSYTHSINTSERYLKIDTLSKTNTDKKYKQNIKQIENIYHIKDWKPSNKRYPLFSNIPLLSSNTKNMDYTLMKQRKKNPKYINQKYIQLKKKQNYVEKYNLSRNTMKDNWRYIAFFYKNKRYLKKDLFSKISNRFMDIIDDKKKMWINADYSPNKLLQ